MARLGGMKSAALTAALVTLPVPAIAQDAPAPISVDELAFMLTGEFDSSRQAAEDAANEVPREARHFVVNRAFVPVETSDLDDPVLVGSTLYFVSRWIVDENEFLVWTFERNEPGTEIVATPRRFKDQAKRIAFMRDGARLSGFGEDDLEPARSGASCKIYWTRMDEGFLGQTRDCTAMSVVYDKMMQWNWRYRVTPDAMMIEFSGTDEDGQVLDTTPVASPYVLDRID